MPPGKPTLEKPELLPEEEFPVVRTWVQKFGDAFRGFKHGVRGESSFFVHFFMAALVVVVGVALEAVVWQWCVLLLCITIVLAAEMFNTALEHLAKAITREHDPWIGTALDIASAGVLIASLGAALVGAVIFLDLLMQMFSR